MPRKKNDWSYEETAAKIEQIISQIESGSLPLEDVFKQFELAAQYLQECESFLHQGKQRMNLIVETLSSEDF